MSQFLTAYNLLCLLLNMAAL
jgi:hypothetical protein